MTTTPVVRSGFPILSTDDVPRQTRFWVEGLGAVQTYQFPEDGEAVYVSLDVGGARLGLGGDPAMASEPHQHRISLWFDVDDCDAAVDRLVAAGAVVLDPPADRPWGERTATVADLDGNRVHLGAPGTA